jgi:hypothetical protein
MHIALVRSLWFALLVLLIVAAWEVLTFELPREPMSSIWKQHLVVHLLLVIAIGGGALLGSFLSFYFFPVAGLFPIFRLAVMGGAFALVTFLQLRKWPNSAVLWPRLFHQSFWPQFWCNRFGRLLAKSGV